MVQTHPKNKPQFKKDPIELDVTKKKCYVYGKLGHLK